MLVDLYVGSIWARSVVMKDKQQLDQVLKQLGIDDRSKIGIKLIGGLPHSVKYAKLYFMNLGQLQWFYTNVVGWLQLEDVIGIEEWEERRCYFDKR